MFRKMFICESDVRIGVCMRTCVCMRARVRICVCIGGRTRLIIPKLSYQVGTNIKTYKKGCCDSALHRITRTQ